MMLPSPLMSTAFPQWRQVSQQSAQRDIESFSKRPGFELFYFGFFRDAARRRYLGQLCVCRNWKGLDGKNSRSLCHHSSILIDRLKVRCLPRPPLNWRRYTRVRSVHKEFQ
jgi:hypothetical protein